MIKKLEIWCEKVTGLHMKARSTMKKVYLEFWSPQSISQILAMATTALSATFCPNISVLFDLDFHL